MAWLVLKLDNVVPWAEIVKWHRKLGVHASRRLLVTEGTVAMHSAIRDLQARLQVIHGAQDVPPPPPCVATKRPPMHMGLNWCTWRP